MRQILRLKQKFDRVRLKQAAFLANAYSQASLDVGVLDFKDPRLGNVMLRQLIMDIRSHEDSTKLVFISVDRHFQGRGVMFQFTSNFAKEAPAWIRGLLPYLKSKFAGSAHRQIKKYFTPEAVLRASSYVWDPARSCIVSSADAAVSALLDDWDLDDEFAFPDTDTSKFELDISAIQEEGKPVAKAPATGKDKAGTNPYDADSVSTFVSRHTEGHQAVTSQGSKSSTSSKASSSMAATRKSMGLITEKRLDKK